MTPDDSSRVALSTALIWLKAAIKQRIELKKRIRSFDTPDEISLPSGQQVPNIVSTPPLVNSDEFLPQRPPARVVEEISKPVTLVRVEDLRQVSEIDLELPQKRGYLSTIAIRYRGSLQNSRLFLMARKLFTKFSN